MTQPNFTPGPWEQNGMAVNGGEGERVCLVARQGLRGIAWADQAETDANVLLIAAAPDLYRALEACHLQLLQSNNATEYAQEACGMACAALTKAGKNVTR